MLDSTYVNIYVLYIVLIIEIIFSLQLKNVTKILYIFVLLFEIKNVYINIAVIIQFSLEPLDT